MLLLLLSFHPVSILHHRCSSYMLRRLVNRPTYFYYRLQQLRQTHEDDLQCGHRADEPGSIVSGRLQPMLGTS